MDDNLTIEWEAPEYVHYERSREWYIALFIISGALVASAIIVKNFLFGVIVVISAFTIWLYSKMTPSIVRTRISREGIAVGKNFYPYQNLDNFWIDSVDPDDARLLLRSKKKLMTLIVVPLGNIDWTEVRSFLQNYLEEKELHEPTSQKVAEYLGL